MAWKKSKEQCSREMHCHCDFLPNIKIKMGCVFTLMQRAGWNEASRLWASSASSGGVQAPAQKWTGGLCRGRAWKGGIPGPWHWAHLSPRLRLWGRPHACLWWRCRLKRTQSKNNEPRRVGPWDRTACGCAGATAGPRQRPRSAEDSRTWTFWGRADCFCAIFDLGREDLTSQECCF